jgi:hypothetical protein
MSTARLGSHIRQALAVRNLGKGCHACCPSLGYRFLPVSIAHLGRLQRLHCPCRATGSFDCGESCREAGVCSCVESVDVTDKLGTTAAPFQNDLAAMKCLSSARCATLTIVAFGSSRMTFPSFCPVSFRPTLMSLRRARQYPGCAAAIGQTPAAVFLRRTRSDPREHLPRSFS